MYGIIIFRFNAIGFKKIVSSIFITLDNEY